MSENSIHSQPRDFRIRMRWALVAALVVHACLLFVPMGYRNQGSLFLPPTHDRQPVVVSLQPRDEPKMLITPGAAAEAPVDSSTNLIAERASKAQDMTPGTGDGITPDAGAVGPIDDIVSAPAPKPIASEAATPAPPEPAESVAPEPKVDPNEAPRPAANEAVPPAPKPLERVETAEPAIPEPEQPPSDATIQLAKAETPQPTQHVMGETQSHVEGGVTSQGFLSFEAKQSEFAPYLRDVRDRVEKRWKAIMHIRYSGASTAQAVVDCAISPDGKLNRVSIVEPGASATFAGLCKQAIEQAGPFGPFPFRVPEVYQNPNIEIRWTFSFL